MLGTKRHKGPFGISDFTEEMQGQITATVSLVQRSTGTLDQRQKAEINELLKRLVKTCLSLATVPIEEEPIHQLCTKLLEVADGADLVEERDALYAFVEQFDIGREMIIAKYD